MESAPAVFAGVTLAVFGAGLALWISVRTWSREPVAEGVEERPAVALAGLFAVMSLMVGGWVLFLA